jgi:hypothetical protein
LGLPKRNCGLAIKITPKKLQNPENDSLKEMVSLRNIAPEKPVRIGATNVNMVASDNDR